MKIAWLGDGGVQTGFGRVTTELTDRLVGMGHDVSILAVNYRGDAAPSKVRMFMPTQKVPTDIFGYTRVVEVLGDVEPDVVVILNDPFICLHYLFTNEFDPQQILLRYRPVVTYQPRDGTNPPETWDRLRTIAGKDGTAFPVSRQVAMSKFGQAMMPGSDLVYHGIDTEVFHQATPQRPLFSSNGKRITSKADAKEAFGYPSAAFLVLRVDKNSWRKDFASTWKALLPSMHKHSDILVHFHCAGSGRGENGVQMPALWTRDMETAPRFNLPDRLDTFSNWQINDLVALYNAADVFVTTSMGEGFGLTIAEALACGTPVIAQNVSSIPEVVGPGGMLIEPGYTVTAPGGQDLAAADVGAFSEAIEHLYLNDGFRKRYGRAGAKHVADTFNWDAEASKFEHILTETVEQTELAPVEVSA